MTKIFGLHRYRLRSGRGIAILLAALGEAVSRVSASPGSASPLAASVTMTIGERPAVEQHLEQSRIDSGDLSFALLLRHGKKIFEAEFNELDGRLTSQGPGTAAPVAQNPTPPPFTRTSGPDANSCSSCHNKPYSGGAGDFTVNAFVLQPDGVPVTFSVDPAFSNERNTVGMMGSGPIEMLAREMTAELVATREAALKQARLQKHPVRLALLTKGIGFGAVTVLLDGRVDPTEIEGVDWDLIVKPFHQKGAVASLREFTNTALTRHFGLLSAERAAISTQAGGAAPLAALSVGDVTALTLFQAALNTPGRVLSSNPTRQLAATRGEVLFGQLRCSECHVPALVLNSPVFTEPSPFNPPGNLLLANVPHPFSFDMTRDGPLPRLEKTAGGKAVVRAFSDLKRHDLCDRDITFFGNEQVPQGYLTGLSGPELFTLPRKPRPLHQFLTAKLWCVGNSAPYGHRGDLTTMTAAIQFHGGEARSSREAFLALPVEDRAAVIEFLKTLRVLPEGSAPVLTEGP